MRPTGTPSCRSKGSRKTNSGGLTGNSREDHAPARWGPSTSFTDPRRRGRRVAVRGEGIYLIDEHGRRYIDACGGAAVSCLGHGHPEVVAAMPEQAARLEYVHTGFFTSEAAEELAAMVAEMSPGTLDRVWYTSSGSEAIEAALKLARQYHLERGDSGAHARHRAAAELSRQHAGRARRRRKRVAARALRAVADRRRAGRSLLRISLCRAGRERRGHMAPGRPTRSNRKSSGLVRKRSSAFVAETVVGATAGAVPPVPGYLQQVREICDRHGVLLILDEVMCGSGRTGTFLSCEQDGVVPDIVTLGKGLGAGYQPIGAVVCTSDVYDDGRAGLGRAQARPDLQRASGGLRRRARGAARHSGRRAARPRAGARARG